MERGGGGMKTKDILKKLAKKAQCERRGKHTHKMKTAVGKKAQSETKLKKKHTQHRKGNHIQTSTQEHKKKTQKTNQNRR